MAHFLDEPIAWRRDPLEPLTEIIGQVYEAAHDESVWADVAPRIARAFGSPSAALIAVGDGAYHVIARTPDVDDAWVREYQAHYRRVTASGGARQEAWSAALSPPLQGNVGGLPVLIELPCGEQGKTGAGPSHGIGSVVSVASGSNAVFGVHRPSDAPPYDADDKDRLGQFLPHLQRALRLRRQFGHAGIAARAGLDRLERSLVATLVAGRDRRIEYANLAAERLVSAGDGIKMAGGRLLAGNRTVTERLARLIGAAIDGAVARDMSAGGMLALPRERGLPLTALVAPLRPTDRVLVDGAPSAILFIRDPEERRLSCQALQSLFGLTGAEAVLASALAGGKALSDIALGCGISLHTARVHLKSVFAKTGTSRQAELVAMLLSSVAGLALPG